MKNKKVFVLLSALALLLGACNGNGGSKSQGGASTSAPEVTTSAPAGSDSSAAESSSSQGGGTQEKAVTGLTLNKTELSIEAGKSETLTVEVAPKDASNTKVTWSSSDETVAKVSTLGKVTALKVGTAKITVKSQSNPEVTAECTVTVTEEGGKYGSVNNPKTVAQALAIAAEECKEKDAYTAEDVYVTGYISRAVTNKDGFSQNIYLKDSLTDANAKEFLVYTADHTAALTPYQNDKIVVHGKIQNYNDKTIEMTSKDKVNPAIDKVERGTSSINYIIDDGTVNANAPKAAKNLEEISFTVTPAQGKSVNSVFANGAKVDAQNDGSYKVRVTGNMTITINIFETGVEIQNAVMKYTGSETTNMVDGNNAETMNLDATLFDVRGDNVTGNFPGLNKNGDFRLYNGYKNASDRTQGTTVVISSKRAEIKKIVITLASTTVSKFADLQVKAGETVVPAGQNEGIYTMSSNTVSLKNVSNAEASSQIHIASVSLFYAVKEVVKATEITLDKATAEVEVDKTVQLTATLKPSNANEPVVWATSDATKATVNTDGKVTGVAEGNITITAFVDANEDGKLDANELKAECAVTVKKGETINYGTQENPLTVEEAKAVLDKTGTNESKQPLFVKGIVSTNSAYSADYGNYSEVWLKSTDGATAKAFELFRTKVDSSITNQWTAKDALAGCEVVAKGFGKIYGTTYELTTSSNEPKNPLILSIVPPAAVDPTGVKLDKATAEVQVGNTVQLTATLEPAGAVGTVAWKSSDTAKATVNAGAVTGVAEGNVTITAFVDANANGEVDANELKAECAVTVKAAATQAVYSLKKVGTTSSYTGSSDITFADGKVWNIPGNQTLDNGLKLGGKLSGNVDRALYSKSSYASVASIKVTHGDKDEQITVNSLTLYVFDSAADAAAGDPTKATETVVGAYEASAATEFKPAAEGTKWTGKFFRIVYNMKSTAPSSNKGIMLTELMLVY